MGWTYGVMGETQITASRARGGGGYGFPPRESVFSHQTGSFFHQAGGGNFFFTRLGENLFQGSRRQFFPEKLINEDLVRGGSRI